MQFVFVFVTLTVYYRGIVLVTIYNQIYIIITICLSNVTLRSAYHIT